MTHEPPTAETDSEWMARALHEARAGRPSPNPPVGAIVVKDGVVVGKGHHVAAGRDHAEVVALKQAGANAEGATLYVTLEPCNHVGRTPPCTAAILAAKVARVVIGCPDPNPHVSGGGATALDAAGIEVVRGVHEAACRAWIAPWTKFVTTGFPYVSLKLALSLDGRIATRSGASRWVTGADARAKVHVLRSQHDAVAVGIGTALADDPRLTVRDCVGESPVRVVFDTQLRLPVTSRLVQIARAPRTWVLCGEQASESAEAALVAHGVEVIRVPHSTEGRVHVASALESLAHRGVVSLMVEGGAELAGSFLAGHLADELHAFIAPSLFGPRGRPGAVDWAGPDTPQEAPRIASPTWEVCGEDAYVHGVIRYGEG